MLPHSIVRKLPYKRAPEISLFYNGIFLPHQRSGKLLESLNLLTLQT